VEGASFRQALTNLINHHSMEGGSDTPDCILAQFLDESLGVFDRACVARSAWYSND